MSVIHHIIRIALVISSFAAGFIIFSGMLQRSNASYIIEEGLNIKGIYTFVVNFPTETLVCLAVSAIALKMLFPGTPKRDFSDASRLRSSYDFIIVGAGSAGCPLAARLSEDPNKSVLLIEAGPDDDVQEILIPLACSQLQKTRRDWQYKTTDQGDRAMKNMIDQKNNWPRGKCLGGSSAINYMAWVRGNKADYDSWAKNEGCEGWSYEDCLPFFQGIEDNQCKLAQKDTKYIGKGGPITVSDLKFVHPSMTATVEGAKEVGLKFNPNYNGAEQEGISFIQTNQKNGERVSTARAYLEPAAHRPNFDILTEAQVTKVIFNDKKEACGVAFKRTADSPEHVIAANKEVILSAGAIGSPHILMLSGVGPKEELTKHNIDVISDLPVGKNLQDHLFCGYGLECDVGGITEATAKSLTNVLKYLLLRDGMLTSNGLEITGFFKTGVRPDLGEMPDMQLHAVASIGTRKDQINFGTKPEHYLDTDVVRTGLTLLPVMLHPQSVGEITLNSADPFDHPIIEPNYLSHENDVKSLVEALKMCRRISETKPMKAIGARLPALRPGLPDELPEHSDEWYAEIVRRTASTCYHPIGTCKMGPEDSKTSVVDTDGRVLGVSKLRVADASIMPHLVSGNTNAPSIMIGEKIAAHIIEEQL